MKQHDRLAMDYFVRGYNCAQAVACAYAEEMGLSAEQAARMLSSFGGGMGKLREVCGAVSGALFVLGNLRGYSDPDDEQGKACHYARVQEFAARFKAKHETIICRELLKGLELKREDTPAPDPRSERYYRERPCARYVETAAQLLDEMLAE